MGRTPLALNRGPWTRDEDVRLTNYIKAHGEAGWVALPAKAGLLRCGKSCRLRWLNYLRPDVKRGHILPDEEDLIIRLHRLLGNRWALIAGRIPGRTDNEIKNYWNTNLSKKLISQGINPRTHKHFSEPQDKGSNPGEREVSQKTQWENNRTIPARSIAESRADHLQAMPSKGGGAIAGHDNQDDRASTAWPPLNNQFPQASLAYNPTPRILSHSTNTNNIGSKQSYFDPLTPCKAFRSSARDGVGRYDLDQNLLKNPVTSSNDMIASTVRLSSGLITAPFATQFKSSHAFLSGNALLNGKHAGMSSLQSLQDFETNPHSSFIVNPYEEADSHQLSHTSCVASEQNAAACSCHYPIIPTVMGAALGDFNSDIFPSLLKSFGNEELMQLEEGYSADTSIAQNVQACLLNENLTSYDLLAKLCPWSQYQP